MRNLIVQATNPEEARVLLAHVVSRGRDAGARAVRERVSEILESVRSGKNEALIAWARNLDGFTGTAAEMEVGPQKAELAWNSLSSELREALAFAKDRVGEYHRKIRETMVDLPPVGTMAGFRWTPIEKVGVYVPGGTALYPSTVLMTVPVARAAGVREIVVITPAGPDGLSPVVLGACHLAGVDRIFAVGGVHGVAALAFGTETIPAVDQIVGPGNRYVTEAKRQLFGIIDIDMIAGPTEVVIAADCGANPEWIAADMLAQAEHDPQASAVLLTDSAALAASVEKSLIIQLDILPRKEIAARSLDQFGAILVLPTLDAIAGIVDWLAPEHLELCLADAMGFSRKVRNAGAIFLGEGIPEAAGDYCFGPSHVLPTNGSARFASPISIETFMKRTSLLGFEKNDGPARDDTEMILRVSEILARSEGLEGHARSAGLRRNSGSPA